jgi:hypothetical protein
MGSGFMYSGAGVTRTPYSKRSITLGGRRGHISGFEGSYDLDSEGYKPGRFSDQLPTLGDSLGMFIESVALKRQLKRSKLDAEMASIKEIQRLNMESYRGKRNAIGATLIGSAGLGLGLTAPAMLSGVGLASLLPQTAGGLAMELGLTSAYSGYDYYSDPTNFSPLSIPTNIIAGLLGGAGMKLGLGGLGLGYRGLKSLSGVSGKGVKGMSELAKAGWNYPLPWAKLKTKTPSYNMDGDILNPSMIGFANGGWVPNRTVANRPRSHFQSGGKVMGDTINNYSTTANVTLQSTGSEAYDARRLMDAINRESHRGTRRLTNVS